MFTSTRIARLEAISQRRPFTKAATSLRYSYGGPPEPWRRRKLTRLAKDSLAKSSFESFVVFAIIVMSRRPWL